MHTLKLTQIGNSVGAVFPRELLNQLQLDKGDQLYVTAGAAGIAILRLADGAERAPPTVGPTLTPLPTDDPARPTPTNQVQPLPSSTPAPPGATATVVVRPTATAEGRGALRSLWLPMTWR